MSNDVEDLRNEIRELYQKGNLSDEEAEELEEKLDDLKEKYASESLPLSEFDLTSLDDWDEFDSKVQDRVFEIVSEKLQDLSEYVDERREKIN